MLLMLYKTADSAWSRPSRINAAQFPDPFIGAPTLFCSRWGRVCLVWARAKDGPNFVTWVGRGVVKGVLWVLHKVLW